MKIILVLLTTCTVFIGTANAGRSYWEEHAIRLVKQACDNAPDKHWDSGRERCYFYCAGLRDSDFIRGRHIKVFNGPSACFDRRCAPGFGAEEKADGTFNYNVCLPCPHNKNSINGICVECQEPFVLHNGRCIPPCDNRIQQVDPTMMIITLGP